jgi:tyrosine-protein kinase Etk/Wzc
LVDITDSLSFVETTLQDFRISNEVMNLDFKANQVFSSMKELEEQKAQLMVKAKYYRNLQNYLLQQTEKLDDIVIPSAMGIEDPLLTQLLSGLVNLYADRADLLFSSSERNPAVLAIDQRIATTKRTILENIQSILNTSEISIQDIDSRIARLEVEVNRLPQTQRQLFGIERKFKLNDAIYTFLLQKRSEAQIAKASTLPDNEIIDIARGGGQVYPKKSLNYLISLVLGLVIPVVYILGKDYMNDKIIERQDLEKLTRLPIIGHLIHNNKETQLVVAESPKSSISESFRSVRTNIQYLTKGKEKQTILVTSDMVGAGKTFVSINLASIFAMYDKKTLLMGFDLRKPKIYQDFGLTNTEGISSYLINKSTWMISFRYRR